MFRILDGLDGPDGLISLSGARGISINLVFQEFSKNPRIAMRSKIGEYVKLMRFDVK